MCPTVNGDGAIMNNIAKRNNCDDTGDGAIFISVEHSPVVNIMVMQLSN
ncbi:hypothetical protein [Staphylococcus delphini]|nr:hypothetical protein [Staphylococcus delphini]MDE9798104.1 hypothetical protein [Staphylococcus delphini]